MSQRHTVSAAVLWPAQGAHRYGTLAKLVLVLRLRLRRHGRPFVGAALFIAVGLIDAPQMIETFQSKAFIYKQVVWGGIWGFLLTVPLLRPHWWARGLIVGALATLAAIFIFQPEVPPLTRIVYAFVLNAIFWGLSAAFWRDRVMTEKH